MANSNFLSNCVNAIRRPRRSLKATYYKIFGFGYVKRRITDGPIKGLWFVAGKRIFYSKQFWNGTYELDTCQFIKSNVGDGSVCYDIGANIGYHALIMAKSAGTNGFIYAFELLPKVCEVLKQNFEINSINNFEIVEKAVSSENGTFDVINNIDIDQATLPNLTGEKLKQKVARNPLRETITCTAITIDDFVANGAKPPTFLKIDVEGAEASVLSGAVDTLKKHQPVVLCEIHGEVPAAEVYKILLAQNYDLFCVNEKVTPITCIEEVPTNMYEGHILAKPKNSK